jgi:DNA-binding transcriptional MerR regulator
VSQPVEPLFFKIGEAAARVGVEPHVLRFWTREFPQIQPSRLKGRHRLYSAGDIQLLKEIKRLLYEERFTIEGARKRLEEGPLEVEPNAAAAPAKPLAEPPTKPKAKKAPKTQPEAPAETNLIAGRTAKHWWAEIQRELLSLRRLLVDPRSSLTARGEEEGRDPKLK